MTGILVSRSAVFASISLLKTVELTAPDKLVWAGLALDADEKGHSRSPQGVLKTPLHAPREEDRRHGRLDLTGDLKPVGKPRSAAHVRFLA